MSVAPLNIDDLLGTVRNRVALVGVELEGAWKELPPGVNQLTPDGSVFRNRPPVDMPYIGELPLGPIVPAAIPNMVTKHYPHKINNTCGLHVHMSFDLLWYYGLLMTEEYQETILHYLSRWAKENKFRESHYIWTRLRGESPFCQRGFWPDVQVATKRKEFNRERPGHRYTVIHYCGRQNTIECRVLPMFNTPELAISAILEVIKITNACIYLLGKGKKSKTLATGKVELTDGISYEESLEILI